MSVKTGTLEDCNKYKMSFPHHHTKPNRTISSSELVRERKNGLPLTLQLPTSFCSNLVFECVLRPAPASVFRYSRAPLDARDLHNTFSFNRTASPRRHYFRQVLVTEASTIYRRLSLGTARKIRSRKAGTMNTSPSARVTRGRGCWDVIL